jgi:integrase
MRARLRARHRSSLALAQEARAKGSRLEEAAKGPALADGTARTWSQTGLERRREIELLTAPQIQTVLQTLRGRTLYPIAITALATGMRRGELLALRWQDVDLNGARLRVERSLEQTTRGGLVFKSPKTRHGRRTITLPASTVAELRTHWKAQQERRMALGQGKAPEDSLVFAAWHGSTRSPNALTKEWALAMSKAGLPITLHSLRHTHASTLIASGLDVLDDQPPSRAWLAGHYPERLRASVQNG